MEKYSNTCKFILISDQLSKIIEPLRSRCLLIRVPLPTDEQILEILLYICHKEDINISFVKLKEIIKNSDNKLNHAIWLLEMYKYNIQYTKNWEIIIESIVETINNFKIINNKKLYLLLKNIRDQFYILFITNISTQMIFRNIMIKLLEINTDINLKYNIINITSIHEEMLSQGTRHVIHFESFIIKLLFLFNDYNINKK
jgi:replication factor C subunit 3/5